MMPRKAKLEPTDDAALIAKWAEITDPVEALGQMFEYSMFVGSDPYYRDLNDALWEMTERALTTARNLRNSGAN